MKFTINSAVLLIALVAAPIQAAKDWWEGCNLYQIYPRSFKDSDGDGVGDLNGIAEKIGYLKEIGMDATWLSPIFTSPMADFGYDISDYKSIHHEYGTTEDLINLIRKAHDIGIKVILDFVPNHTSDEHEWFKRSVEGDPYYRDFYIWHPGVWNATTQKHDPPSNWNSRFRYSAWEWNDKRQAYYLHQFSKKQVDLNYRNPNVVAAMDDVMRFWLEKGVDGFRVDAVDFIYESEIDPATGTYPDEPVIDNVSECPDPDDWCHFKHIHTNSRPECIDLTFHWRDLVDDWTRTYKTETKILLTEAYAEIDYVLDMYGNGTRKGAHVPFNFDLLMQLNKNSSAADYKYYVDEWVRRVPQGSYPNWVMGNHDRKRIATRLGVERIDLINILLQTLPGITVTFNGEELGMQDVYIPWEQTVDPQGCNANPKTFNEYSRDPVRTPFRWDGTENVGFTTAAKPWLPVGPGYKRNNVAAQTKAKRSHLKVFKAVNHLRRTENALIDGGIETKAVYDVLLYKRQSNRGDAFLVILNFGKKPVKINLRKHFSGIGRKARVAVSSVQSGIKNGKKIKSKAFKAKPYVGYVLRL